MKNIIFTVLTFIVATTFSQAEASYTPSHYNYTTEVKFASYPREFKPLIQMMMRVPEVRQLLAAVQKQGPVSIQICKNRNDGFVGYWDGHDRTIVIDGKSCRNPGKVINTILFELHNAISDYRFEHLNEMARSGQIDKETFVRETERVEHDNVLKCSMLVNSGIQQRILPQDARMPVIKNFDTHYQVQQLTGHSQHLVWCYDEYNPNNRMGFVGTIHGFDRMSEQDKDYLLNQLVDRNVEWRS